MRYVFEAETTAQDGARVAVSIPTTRPRILGQALAALANQTFQDFEVWIVYDDQMIVAEETAKIIKVLSVGHTVRELRGTGEGQVYAHNAVLWRTKSELCLRLDDDVLLDKTALEKMVAYLDGNSEVAAVGGLWFPEGNKRRRLQGDDDPASTSKVDNVHAGVQINYHPGSDPVEMEHLYSVSLYRTELMRKAGGWPVCYTKRLHHREETDGTHRLLLMGHKLVVLPFVTGTHLWAPGGVRQDPSVAEGYGSKREADDQKFYIDRLPQLRELVMPKKVVVYSEHTSHAAGGERHFYATLAALSECDDLEVWGGDVGQGFFGPDKVKELFGFDTSRVKGFKRRWEWAKEDQVDLAVSVSHAMVPWIPANAFMGVVLFPMEERYLKSFHRLYANSRYTAFHIKKYWIRDAGIIYPPPGKFEYKPDAKENRITLVGWYGTHKGQWEAVQAFRRANIHGWRLTLVGWRGIGEQLYFNAVARGVGNDPNIELLGEVGQEELQGIVESSRVILGMRGISVREPQSQEHFGLSVPEAMSAGAVPLLYRSGGYLEVYPRYTFSNVSEFSIMMKTMTRWTPKRWDIEARMAVAKSQSYGYERYRDEIVAATYEALRAGVEEKTPYVVGELAQTPDIAVVIPNHNHDEHLWESIGSALASTYRDFEVVIVDDGSPDKSASAGMYKSDKVRIVRQEQAGPSIARNAGISSSDARMVFPLDADDFMLPDALRQLRKANDGERITFGDCILLREDEELVRTNLGEYDFAKLLEKATLPQSALFPRWAWDQAGGYKPLDGYEDWEFWISLGEVGCAGKKVDVVSHVYRESSTGGRHLEAKEMDAKLVGEIREIHRNAYGNPTVGCCGPKERPVLPEWLAGDVPDGVAADSPDAEVRKEVPMIYDGPDTAPFSLRGDKSRKVYRVREGKEFSVSWMDVEFIASVPGFRRV